MPPVARAVPTHLQYEAVLGHAGTPADTAYSLDDIAEVMCALAALCEPVDISFRLRPTLCYADDEMVLEAALNGRADARKIGALETAEEFLSEQAAVSTAGDLTRFLDKAPDASPEPGDERPA